MNWHVIHPADQRTSTWSGGTTTELFVSPPEADYAKRDFDFRISSATVEAESTDFTSLPGYRRHIMPLEGKLELEHHGHYGAELTPFDADIFDGGWQTKSFGRCTDFNLMYTKDWTGGLCGVESSPIICHPGGFTGVFARSEMSLTMGDDSGEALTLAPGDFLMVTLADDDAGFRIHVTSGIGPGSPCIVATCHRKRAPRLKI